MIRLLTSLKEVHKSDLLSVCNSVQGLGTHFNNNTPFPDRADVEVCDQFFWTPLHHAAYAGQVELIELLVQAGAVVDARGLGRGTPLMRAIETSRPSCVDLLIKAGANVNAENKKGLFI